MRWTLCVLMVASLTGCAYLGLGTSENPVAAVAATERQMAKQEAALGRPRPRRGKVSCTRARALRDDLCTLGQRVCLLSTDEPAIPGGAEHCKQASLKCEKASTRATASCRPTRAARARVPAPAAAAEGAVPASVVSTSPPN